MARRSFHIVARALSGASPLLADTTITTISAKRSLPPLLPSCWRHFGVDALPSNIVLADDNLLREEIEEDAPHQVAPVDAMAKDSASEEVKGRAVYQRSGLAPGAAALQIPVVAFTDYDVADLLPQPPPSVVLDARVFGAPLRLDVLQTVVKWQLACQRQGTSSSKRIGGIRGSGKKMRPQKGTGQARAGHKRPPQWRGGAKAHGPITGGRDWEYKLNKRERRLGLATALSQKLAEGNLSVMDRASASTHHTAGLSTRLCIFDWNDALFVVESTHGDRGVCGEGSSFPEATGNRHFIKAAKNIPAVQVLPTAAANVYDVLRHKKLILTLGAVRELEDRLGAFVRRDC